MSSKSSVKEKGSKLTQKEIETKIKTNFTNISDANVKIIGYYLYKYPSKWNQDGNDTEFMADVNKLMPEAFAHNMMPSNVMFGAVLVIIIMLLAGLMWWVISLFMHKNNKNILNDPNIVNPAFI